MSTKKDTKLAKYFKFHGISQRRFSEILGCTPNTLNLIVRGKSTPTIKIAYRIEQLTNGKVKMLDWVTLEMREGWFPNVEDLPCK